MGGLIPTPCLTKLILILFSFVSAIPSDFPVHLSLDMADTPLSVERVTFWLDRYPNLEHRSILKMGVTSGFRLHSSVNHKSVHFSNHGSARRNPQVVWKKLAKEVGAGRMAGPFAQLPDLPFHRICPLTDLTPSTLGHHGTPGAAILGPRSVWVTVAARPLGDPSQLGPRAVHSHPRVLVTPSRSPPGTALTWGHPPGDPVPDPWSPLPIHSRSGMGT